jgi:predicted nucleic-acid-binding Zn-ribbon protein
MTNLTQPPACPTCRSTAMPRLTLIGPKGIPLTFPPIAGVRMNEDDFWSLVTKLRITPELTCSECGYTYVWSAPVPDDVP